MGNPLKRGGAATLAPAVRPRNYADETTEICTPIGRSPLKVGFCRTGASRPRQTAYGMD